MATIYWADSKVFQGKKDLAKLLHRLPISMHERAFRYKFEQAAFNFVLGRSLLKKGLEDFGEEDKIDKIEYRKTGKPFLKDVFFNISHSDSLVVCAISTEGEIGIDIEKVKPVELDDFKPWFTENEWKSINKPPSQLDNFYWYWTRKESIIKALGINLSHLHQIDVDATKDYFLENGKKWCLKDLDFGEGIFGALCSSYQVDELELIEVNQF